MNKQKKILEILNKHNIAHSPEPDEYVRLSKVLAEGHIIAYPKELADYTVKHILGDLEYHRHHELIEDFKKI